MKEIYLLDHKIFHYFDEEDGENVETVFTVGYLSTYEKVEKAIDLCLSRGLKREDLYVSKFDFVCNDPQCVYVLTYDYSVFKGEECIDGIWFPIYNDYFYKFAPKTNEQDCLNLKEELLKDSKYSKTANKIYDYDYTEDGFYIQKIEIDFIWISNVPYPIEPYCGEV